MIYCSELDPEWKISFAVEVTSQMKTVTAERLEAALHEDSVRIVCPSLSFPCSPADYL
jgi:hypothetical protein